ncbi:MAG: hypothetical protein J6X61_01810 [Clostridia bacterium]|nr:hypothetical protein [Clostridia bacterium]
MLDHSELNGAWEEPGVIGTRIEIEENRIVVLWRSAPVLTTTFRIQAGEEGEELLLKRAGMRYENAASDYATVAGLVYRDGVLTLTEDFPISGVSVTCLKKTANSRYGAFDAADERLGELAGTWKERGGYLTLTVTGDVMDLDGRQGRIHLLRSRNDPPGAPLAIRDADPSVFAWGGIDGLTYDGERITGYRRICDASSEFLVFEKE